MPADNFIALAEQTSYSALSTNFVRYLRAYDTSNDEFNSAREPETFMGKIYPGDEHEGIKSTSWSNEVPVTYEGLELYFYHALGAQSSDGNTHTFTVASGVPDHGLTAVHVKNLSPTSSAAKWIRGVKIGSFTFSATAGEPVQMTFEGVGASTTLSGIPSNPTYPDYQNVRTKFSHINLEISGVNYPVKSVTVNFDGNLATSEGILGSGYIAEPYRQGKVETTVEFELYEYSKDLYDNHIGSDSRLGSAVIACSGAAGYSLGFGFDELRVETASEPFTESQKIPTTITARVYDNGGDNGPFWVQIINTLTSYNEALS